MYVALIIHTDTPFDYDYADDWKNFRKEMQGGKICGGAMSETEEQVREWARRLGGVVFMDPLSLAERQG